MNRRNISILVIVFLATTLFLLAAEVVFLIFAGFLAAILLHGGGAWVACRTGLRHGFGVAAFGILLVGALVAAGAAFAPSIIAQVDELSSELPERLEQLRDRFAAVSWGERALERLTPEQLLSAEGRSAAATAVSSTFGALGGLLVVIIVGVYGAVDPAPYRRGMLLLLAPSLRERGEEVMLRVVGTLRNWIAAQLMAMAVVGVLTGAGLWLAGVPLALLLGLIAALLAFIPNIGPIIAIIPALLLAFPEGTAALAWVVAIYVGVQALESYIITPLLQQEKVSLPAILVIAVQVLFGVLFGILGLAMAMPLAAAGMTLVRELYIRDYLEQEPAPGKARPPGS